MTFPAVDWDSLPVFARAGIIRTLAAAALAGSIPASLRKLADTAEALAILGTGLFTVDLYGARSLGLIPRNAVDDLTHTGIVFGSVAVVTLVMTRLLTAATVFIGILVASMIRRLTRAVDSYSFFGKLIARLDLPHTIATTAVIWVAAATGIAILRTRPLPSWIPAWLSDGVCASRPRSPSR